MPNPLPSSVTEESKQPESTPQVDSEVHEAVADQLKGFKDNTSDMEDDDN